MYVYTHLPCRFELEQKRAAMEADLRAKGVPEPERNRQLAELARQEEAQEKELEERFTEVRKGT